MTFTTFAALIFAAACIFFVIKRLLKEKKPLKTAFFSAFFGVSALGTVNLLAIYTGISIAVNYITAFVCVVLGAPGVISLLVLRIIFLPQ